MTVILPAATAACQRCKTAKRRCDHGHPKCVGCTKAHAACVIVDPVNSKRYSKEHIGNLLAEERALLARLPDGGVGGAPEHTPASQRRENGIERLSQGGPSPQSVQPSGEFVGDSSGLNLLRSMFSSREWAAQKDVILRQASQQVPLPELNMTANQLPTFDEAFALLNNYFSRFHIHHSFLVRDDVFATFDRVYTADTTACLPQDRFRLFLIFAISGVTRYRAGLTSEHPYGYYLAALRYIDRIALIGGAEAIQNLLLIARFGMYYHVGISLWDIAQSCMRQCVELGYHAGVIRPAIALDEQKRRRIFWACYILDRYSSGMLGRPFAIADDDCSIDIPVAANDETVRSAESLSSVVAPVLQQPTELSVFVFCIKLRRISSRIRTDFYQAAPTTLAAAGDAQAKVSEYLQELDQWRAEAPVFASPGSLYERQEWYDFLLETDRLALLRAAMHASPRWRNNRPPPRLFRLNIESAARAIDLYAGMLNANFITWTRNYFHTLFSAGISIISALALEPSDREWYVADADRFWPALNSCATILGKFQRQMPDASAFAIIFTETLKHLRQKRPDATGGYGDEANALERNLLTDAAGNEMLSTAGWLAPMDGSLANQVGFQPLDVFDQGAFLSEGIMQSLEMELGQYACGFPGDDPFNFEVPQM